jgi:hypothetical protein
MLISTGLVAAAIFTSIPSTALAQDKNEKNDRYWRDHWRWYDSTYRPYYYRRSTLYVPPLPPDDPRITGSYGPYWGPYFGGTVAYGPGIQYGWW